MTDWLTHNVDGDSDTLAGEWLVTNGTGAYAMGTAAGANTRRYHGLLVAAAHPPVGRVIALNQMLEQLVVGGKTLEFATCAFRGHDEETFAPSGVNMLTRFERGLHVQWVYEHEDIRFTRELYLHWKQQAATLRYTVEGGGTLRLSPMLTLRDFHSLLREKDAKLKVTAKGDTLTAKSGDAAVTMHCPGAKFAKAKPTDQWWYDLHYPVDAERGQDDLEDCHVPGAFEVDAGGEVLLTVALGEDVAKPHAAVDDRAAHLKPMAAALGDDKVLAIAADDFVVDRTIRGMDLSTILAGYPWFADWGRDTFIALPGLLLATGRHGEARDTLHAYALAIKDGLVPNRFDDYDDDTAHYNTVDASLWFVHAAMEYRDAAGDDASWNDWLRDAVLQVIDAYLKSTNELIHMAGDGLITAGDATTQLTWMDAKHGDDVFTPRQGKAVEINALWYHALLGMSEKLADSDKRRSEHFKKLGGRIRRAFAKVFWDDELGHLRDHVWIDSEGNEVADRSMRPNQIFAAALPNSPMPRTKLTTMVGHVKEKLLTPFGLRTLAADDRHYHATYTGPQRDRDEAYHQGTIWPWLIGPYAEAVLRVGQFSDDAKAEARAAIDPLLDLLHGEGLGQLHEIHEAQPPHRPVGCMAQAWSVAQVIRVLQLIDR